MNKFITYILLIFIIKNNAQNCVADFSLTIKTNTVEITNLSNINNAHYYWDFGDCLSSNLKSPTHKFYINGKYLITLYVFDTISNCTSFKEKWVSIVIPSTLTCKPFIDDSIYITPSNPNQNVVEIIEKSQMCSGLNKQCFIYGGASIPGTMVFGANPLNRPNYHSYNLVYINYWSNQDPVSKKALQAAKTLPLGFNKNLNYNKCSSNYEKVIVSQDSNSQVILFKAMNKNAKNYTWIFTGNGDPEYISKDTVYRKYIWPIYENPDATYSNFVVNQRVWLLTEDFDGCKDSTIQYVRIADKNTTWMNNNTTDEDLKYNSPYPNPFTSEININYNSSFNLQINNAIGQVLLKQNFNNSIKLNTSLWLKGVYYLKLNDNKTIKTFKLIKE